MNASDGVPYNSMHRGQPNIYRNLYILYASAKIPEILSNHSLICKYRGDLEDQRQSSTHWKGVKNASLLNTIREKWHSSQYYSLYRGNLTTPWYQLYPHMRPWNQERKSPQKFRSDNFRKGEQEKMAHIYQKLTDSDATDSLYDS